MLYSLKMQQQIPQEDIIYFMTNTQTIQHHSLHYVFTNAHAILRLTNFYTDLKCLGKIDWAVMQTPMWRDTDEDPNRKARRQAEFLVYNEVPLSACIGFAVYNFQTKQKVEDILRNSDLTLPVAIRSQFYF